MAELIARSRRYAGPDSRPDKGIVRRLAVEVELEDTLPGMHVASKLVRQSIEPPGAMPHGRNRRVSEHKV
jgi:hypothetical protein